MVVPLRLPSRLLCLLPSLTFLLLSSCAAPYGGSSGGPPTWSSIYEEFSVSVEAFGHSVEFDEIETERLFRNGATQKVDIEDADRNRVGVRTRFGTADFSGFIDIFGEELDQFRDEMEASGFGFGAMGHPVFAELGEELLFIGLFRGQVNFVGGEVDVPIFDPVTGAQIGVDDDEDAYYTELETEFGLGLEFYGVRLGAGLYSSILDGEIDTEPRDLDIEGSNAGAFVKLAFFHPDSWFTGEVNALLGETQGISASLGVKF